MKRLLGAVVILLAAARAAAQEPPKPGLLDQFGPALKDGRMNVDVDLRKGRVPLTSSWAIEVPASPALHLSADAVDGRLKTLHIDVTGGDFVLKGKGLLPDVVLESVDADGVAGVTGARFHGRGLGRLVVAIFRKPVMSAVKKMKFKTDMASVLRGDLLVSEAKPAAGPAPAPPPVAAPAVESPPPAEAKAGPSFMDIVSEVRVKDLALSAFGSKHLAFDPYIDFDTAAVAEGKDALSLTLGSAIYRPALGAEPSTLSLDGGLDGALENGRVAFSGNRLSFARGTISKGRFQMAGSAGAGTKVQADRLALDVTSGRFLMGGVSVELDAPSRFVATELSVAPDGKTSALLELDLTGKTGAVKRQGSTLSLAGVSLKSKGLRLVENRATGDVTLSFDYLLQHTLVVKYPVKNIGERRVPLEFRGPMEAHLTLADAGGEDASVTGSYRFRVAWAPIQQAAFEVLRARWLQDLPAGLKKVEVSIDPQEFGPCGHACFLMKLTLVAEKKREKRSLFKQVCHPEGRADLVVDKEARAFVLKGIKVEPHCDGILGWFAKLVAPLVTKTYQDMVLFQMPPDLPFTIDEVESGESWLEIAGAVSWSAQQ